MLGIMQLAKEYLAAHTSVEPLLLGPIYRRHCLSLPRPAIHTATVTQHICS